MNTCFHLYFSAESDLDDHLSRDILSPEPELLYYRGAEDQESLEHRAEGGAEETPALPWDVRGARDGYDTFSDAP